MYFLKDKIIYLDYASTTPIDIKVINKIIPFLYSNYGNEASNTHKYGIDTKYLINFYKKKIANMINANYKEIVFTSGSTESNNLAIKGITDFYYYKGLNIISTKIEHKSILNVLKCLDNKKFEITYIDPLYNGIIDVKKIKKKIRLDTLLITIIFINNEIGVIQTIKLITNLCKKFNIIIHSDFTQAIGKININIKKYKIDLISFSAHKFYGPKGIGILYITRKPRIKIKPQIYGGGHQNGLRSGTLPTHQIVGIGEACILLSKKNINIGIIKIIGIRNYFLDGLKNIKKVYINSNIKNITPYNLNISFDSIEGESFIMSMNNLAVSTGSACTSLTLEPSYVLKSLNINDEISHSSIRFSFGRFTIYSNIYKIIKKIQDSVYRLRTISYLWKK